MNKCSISVIMATKDTDEKMLRESIESILKQSFEDFEFIIVCDGSVSNLKICKEYQAKDSRIKIIEHKDSKGLPVSLNEAINVAEGKYIARMDSDDISLKNRFSIQYKFLEKNNNINICSTFAKNFGDKNKYIVNAFNKPKDSKAHLLVYNCAVHPTVMIRRSFLIKNNIRYNPQFKYSQDYELWARCCMITDFYIIPKVCLLYRVHNKQISTAKIKEQNKLCEEIYYNNLKNLDDDDTLSDVKYLMFLGGKTYEKISNIELKNFIKKIIKCNKKKKIYNEVALKKILFFTYAKMIRRNNNSSISIFDFFYGHVYSVIIKRTYYLIKCKLKII